jgi:hypothetical protein
MNNHTALTPEDLADDAQKIGRDALTAASGSATEAEAIARNSSETVS